MSQFLRNLDEYQRDIDSPQGYKSQLIIYLQRMTGKSIEALTEWVEKEFQPGGRFAVEVPIAHINVRDPETGDRRQTKVDMLTLMRIVREKELISSPSLTFYVPPHKERSHLSVFIDENIAKRGRVKQEMFAAQAIGDSVLASNKKNEQNSFKTLNNACSGAHCSPFTILYNKSTHSALTSTCRSATSYGNANNEKLLAGNRHYWAAGIAINNILATIDLTDFVAFEKCVNEYNLHVPTVEEVMECIKRGSVNYWINLPAMRRIENLVKNISPLERAAFLYIGDLYHLRMYNPEIIRDWLNKVIQRVDTPCTKEEYANIEKSVGGDLRALVALLRMDILKGGNFKSVKDTLTTDTPRHDDYGILLGTCRQVRNACGEYQTLINEIMTTKNVPASIARMPDVVRKVSLVSDTDSTMATLQEWAMWYCGTESGKTADDVSDALIYIATQNIAHMMASMSANMGVERSNIFRYSMKNEYKFGGFALTNKAKHYFSVITSCEGTVHAKPELEVKGVALRTSNIPPAIMSRFRDTIYEMAMKVKNGAKIELIPILNEVAEIETRIISSVVSGQSEYLKVGQIKNKEAYTEPDKSAYVYYEWWEETFGTKYGTAGDPSYGIVKLSVNLETKTQIKRWIDGMADRELAKRIEDWHKRNPKRTFNHFQLPESIISNSGIPEEILEVANFRKIVFASVEPYYHILECFNIMLIDKNRTRLVSDFYYGIEDLEKLAAQSVG